MRGTRKTADGVSPARAAPWRHVAVGLLASISCALASASGAAAASPARMAPIEAYLMDRADEIALARSAAPASISRDATVLVLARMGYETAVAGTNGFVCMVGRGFSGAPDWPERWDPGIRAAECQNAQAARTMAPIAKLRTAMTLSGKSDAEVLARIKEQLRSGAIPALGPGAMSYMMSKASVLSASADGRDMAHVMFFTPSKDGADWGANKAGSPFMGGSYWFLTNDHEAEATGLPPISVLLLAVSSWSDGTPARMPRM